jgi:transcriptional regulator with XRE-family HTH domain
MPKSIFGGAHQELVAVLISARKSSCLTQAELGAKVAKDQSFVSLIENGQRRVDTLEFIALCKAMKVDPSKAFGLLLERLPETFDI